MANGSDDNTLFGYRQAVVENGKLLIKRDLVQRLSSEDEIYQFSAEAFGMIWYLAMQMSNYNRELAADWVEDALNNYQRGITLSPGANGQLNPYFVEKPADANY